MATANARNARLDVNEMPAVSSGATAARWAIFVALGAAWVAMSGSLYMSEALGWIPCQWCWIQRIFMYPTAIVLALGLANRDRHVPKYSLVLACIGICASTYHIGLQKIPELAKYETCSVGAPCSADPLNWMGFVTVPMLAFTAFAIIIVCSAIALRASAHDDAVLAEAPTSLFSPVPSVLLVVLTIVALFTVMGVIVRSRRPAVVISGSSTTASAIYATSCMGCHGPASAGMQFIRADFLKKSDLEIMTMIREGRAANAIDNTSGKAMPANGGRIGMTDQELKDLVQYLRQTKGG